MIAGAADLIVATESTTLGMGGPAMVEGGGLGTFPPEAIGPIDVQAANGVIDVRVTDEAEAVAVTKRLLAYFQGVTPVGGARPGAAYFATSSRSVATTPTTSTPRSTASRMSSLVTYLREEFAPEMITALARVEGRPVGIIANNPMRLAGAITSDGANTESYFLVCVYAG